jgi:hypothetical protein
VFRSQGKPNGQWCTSRSSDPGTIAERDRQRKQRFRSCAAPRPRPGGALPSARAASAVMTTVTVQISEQSTTVARVLWCRLARTQHGERKQRRIRENTTSATDRCRRRSRGADSCIARAARGNVAGRQQPQPGRKHFSQLNATFAASHTQAWAVGQTRVAASGDGFETLIEEWNGSTWSVVPGAPASASASSLNGVSGSGPSDIWAVGQNAGTSFIEHWNGQSWSHVASPASEPPDGQLNAVSADSPTDAWAGGSAMKVNDPHNSGVTPLIEHWNGTQWSVSPGAINTTGTANSGQILSIAASPRPMSGLWPRWARGTPPSSSTGTEAPGASSHCRSAGPCTDSARCRPMTCGRSATAGSS